MQRTSVCDLALELGDVKAVVFTTLCYLFLLICRFLVRE